MYVGTYADELVISHTQQNSLIRVKKKLHGTKLPKTRRRLVRDHLPV